MIAHLSDLTTPACAVRGDRAFEVALCVLVSAGVVFFGGAHLFFQAAYFEAAVVLAAIHVLRSALCGKLTLPLRAEMLAVGAFVGWGVVQAELGLSRAPDLTREALLRYGAAALVFALTAALARSDAAVRRLSLAIVLLCAFEALYGLSQRYGGHEWILVWPNPQAAGAGGAVTGTYVNRNHFAGLLALATPIVLGRALVERPAPLLCVPRLRTRLALVLGDPALWKRVPLLCIGATGVLATCLSLSRGGMLALAAGLGAFAILTRAMSEVRVRSRGPLLAILAVAALAGLGLNWFGGGPTLRRFEDLPKDLTEGPASRAALARGALRMIADHPLLGVGLGGFELAYPRYQQAAARGIRVDHAHNDLLEIAAEAGTPATAAVCAALATIALRAFRRARGRPEAPLVCGLIGALVAIAARALVDFDLELGGTLGFAAFVAGLLAGRVAADEAPPLRRGPALALATATVALALAIAPYPIRILRADLLVQPTIRTADDERDAAERLAALERAIALRPEKAGYRLEAVRCRHEDFAGRIERVAREAARNLGGSDADADPPEALVRMLASGIRSTRAAEEAGLLGRSLADLHAARASEPENPRVLVALALLTGDREEARRASEVAVRADPWGADTLARAALARLRFAPSDAEAQGWLARGLALEPGLAAKVAPAAIELGAGDALAGNGGTRRGTWPHPRRR